MLKARPPYWRQGLILHMAAAKAVAAARGFLDTSFPSVVFAGWILLPSWQLLGNTIVCLLSLDPQGNASSPAGARGHVHSCLCSGHHPHCQRFSITYKHPLLGTSLPKGTVGCGVQPLPAQPHSCRKTQGDISFGSRQIKYLSVAEAHNTSCL